MSSPAASVPRRSRLGRVVALGAVSLAGAAGVVVASSPASAAFSAMELVNRHSNSCLDVRGGVSTVGTALQITTCTGGAGQRYTTTAAGEIRVTVGGVARCLDTTAAGTANGTRIVIAACSGAASQRWTQTATNALSHPTSGRCVDIFASAVTSGTPAVLWDCKNGGNGSQTWTPTPPATTPPPPPPPPAGGKHAWPYIDITMASPSMVSVAAATGQRFFTTAFVIGSAAGCAPTWGGTIPLTDSRIVGDINAIKAQGGDVTVAFGGAVGPYLEHLCTTQASLAAAYERVIDTLHVTHIDVDVEAAVNIDLMTKALAQVQRERGVTLTFTLLLQADTFGLNPALGTDVLNSAKANGLRVGVVNPMTMDYGLSVPDFGDSVILAAGSVLRQMATIYPELSDAQRKAMLGLTPMIGRNDTGPVFQTQDAQQVISYANTNHIASVAFWSVGRDNGGCPGGGVSPTCSSIAQSTFQFTNIFRGFVG